MYLFVAEGAKLRLARFRYRFLPELRKISFEIPEKKLFSTLASLVLRTSHSSRIIFSLVRAKDGIANSKNEKIHTIVYVARAYMYYNMYAKTSARTNGLRTSRTRALYITYDVSTERIERIERKSTSQTNRIFLSSLARIVIIALSETECGRSDDARSEFFFLRTYVIRLSELYWGKMRLIDDSTGPLSLADLSNNDFWVD